MKIALFTDSFYPGVGGTETAVMGLANSFSKHHDVVVCAPEGKGKYKDDFSFRVLRTKSFKWTSNEFLAFPFQSKKFIKDLDEFAPDILHCHTASPMASYAMYYGKKHNIPVVLTLHTKFSICYCQNWFTKLFLQPLLSPIRKNIKKADVVTTVSWDMFPEIKHYYHFDGNVTVIKNGADFDRILAGNVPPQLAIDKFQLQDKQNVLLFVGLITKYKNLEFLIDSLKILKDTGLPFTALFVGRSLHQPYLEKHAQKIGVRDRMVFCGQITDKDLLSSIYAASDLMLFPSIFDNDPMTVVEAALRQLPSLTLENTGSSERITDNVNGFIEKNDVKAYAQRIYTLLQDKQALKQVGATAKDTIPKTWDQVAEEYLQLYRKTIDNKGKN